MDIRKGNLHVQKFHLRFGVEFISETEDDIIAYYHKHVYEERRPSFVKALGW